VDLWIRVLKDRRRQTSTDTERHRDIGSLKNPAVVYCTDRLRTVVKVHRPVQRNLAVKNGESRIQEEDDDDDAKSGQLSRLVLTSTCFFSPTSQVFFCCCLMGVVALPCFWQLFALTASFSVLPPSCCQVSFLPSCLSQLQTHFLHLRGMSFVFQKLYCHAVPAVLEEQFVYCKP
jgi:hypothetical protein